MNQFNSKFCNDLWIKIKIQVYPTAFITSFLRCKCTCICCLYLRDLLDELRFGLMEYDLESGEYDRDRCRFLSFPPGESSTSCKTETTLT